MASMLARAVLGLLMLAHSGLVCGSARADDAEVDHPPPGALGLGGQAGYAFGSVCRRAASDVVACWRGQPSAGFVLTPRWRFSDTMSVGLLGAVSYSGPSSITRLVQVAGQFRFRPFGTARSGFWFGPDLGVLIALDSIGEGAGKQSTTNAAPSLGVTTGLALLKTAGVELGLDLRGFVNLFGAPEATPEVVDYETQFGIALGLSLALLLGGDDANPRADDDRRADVE